MADRWLVNGDETAGIAPDDRGLAYGDGLFETVAIRAGECRFFNEHFERLVAGCGRLGIPAPPASELLADVHELSDGLEHGTLKIILTRGASQRGYRAPEPCRPTRIVGVQQTTPVSVPISGVRVRYCETAISRNVLLAGMKTLNRLEQVMARSEWTTPEIAEGLMLDDRENVICGTMSNLFVVRAGELCTPDLSECGIHGIMRRTTISAARGQGIAVRETALTQADIAGADDIFLTNSLIGIWPVHQLEEQKYSRGEISKAVAAGLFAVGVAECAP
jgi:4-amino-4-deoxychorismate lyase